MHEFIVNTVKAARGLNGLKFDENDAANPFPMLTGSKWLMLCINSFLLGCVSLSELDSEGIFMSK